MTILVCALESDAPDAVFHLAYYRDLAPGQCLVCSTATPECGIILHGIAGADYFIPLCPLHVTTLSHDGWSVYVIEPDTAVAKVEFRLPGGSREEFELMPPRLLARVRELLARKDGGDGDEDEVDKLLGQLNRETT